jgi:hypothetical protein
MNRITFKRCILGLGIGYSMVMSICFCRSDELEISFDQLWPEGRVAEVLRLSKRLVSCARVIQDGNLVVEERSHKMHELALLTKQFGERMRSLDYEHMKEDEYLYIYTVARQALLLYKMLQDVS